jgi:hypothetical protein
MRCFLVAIAAHLSRMLVAMAAPCSLLDYFFAAAPAAPAAAALPAFLRTTSPT